MMLNFLAYSSAKSAFDPNAGGANYLRIFSNPKAVQTDYYKAGQTLVNFHVAFLNKIPLIELVFVIVIVVGAIYYLAVQRKKPWSPVVPTDEDLTGIAVATG